MVSGSATVVPSIQVDPKRTSEELVVAASSDVRSEESEAGSCATALRTRAALT
jgi:hypothetical protein